MTRRCFIAASVALLISVGLAIGFKPRLYPAYDEGIDYVSIAKLNLGQVHSYYGSRVLHPLVVKIIADATHRPIGARVFWTVSVGSLVALLLILGTYYGVEFASAPWIYGLLVATVIVVDAYRNYYWQDLFYAALCALFFLTLRLNRWISLLPLLMLYITRESTVVLVVVLVVSTLVRRQWAFCSSVLLIGLAGMSTTSLLVHHAIPNQHGVSMLVLDGLKLPFNFAFNVCGVELWTNTISATTDAPRWVADIPGWLHLGNIRQVGYSGFSLLRPVRFLLCMSSGFGILPVLAINSTAQEKVRLLLRRFDRAIAFEYGLLMLVLTPLVGTSPSRYILYAWPLYWIFAAEVLEATAGDLRIRSEFVLLSLAASWVPAFVRLAFGSKPIGPETICAVSAGGMIFSLTILIPIYVRGWYLLNHA